MRREVLSNYRYDIDSYSTANVDNHENFIAFKIGQIVSTWEITIP